MSNEHVSGAFTAVLNGLTLTPKSSPAALIASAYNAREHNLAISDVKQIHREMAQAEGLVELLEELSEYLDDYADADHDGVDYVPNRAMRLRTRCEEQLRRLR